MSFPLPSYAFAVEDPHNFDLSQGWFVVFPHPVALCRLETMPEDPERWQRSGGQAICTDNGPFHAGNLSKAGTAAVRLDQGLRQYLGDQAHSRLMMNTDPAYGTPPKHLLVLMHGHGPSWIGLLRTFPTILWRVERNGVLRHVPEASASSTALEFFAEEGRDYLLGKERVA